MAKTPYWLSAIRFWLLASFSHRTNSPRRIRPKVVSTPQQNDLPPHIFCSSNRPDSRHRIYSPPQYFALYYLLRVNRRRNILHYFPNIRWQMDRWGRRQTWRLAGANLGRPGPNATDDISRLTNRHNRLATATSHKKGQKRHTYTVWPVPNRWHNHRPPLRRRPYSLVPPSINILKMASP